MPGFVKPGLTFDLDHGAAGLAIRSIVHPTDFSDLSFAAFAHALRIALVANSNLHLLHVAQEADEAMAFPHARRLLVQWGLLEEIDPPSVIPTKLGIVLEYVTLHQQRPIVGFYIFSERILATWLCSGPTVAMGLIIGSRDQLRKQCLIDLPFQHFSFPGVREGLSIQLAATSNSGAFWCL